MVWTLSAVVQNREMGWPFGRSRTQVGAYCRTSAVKTGYRHAAQCSMGLPGYKLRLHVLGEWELQQGAQ